MKLPQRGTIYLDTQILVYSIETHPRYAPALNPMWEAADRGEIALATSQLAILETLVRPLKHQATILKTEYDRLFAGDQLYSLPIHELVLRRAAELRAIHPGLRTPDAIHVATALHVQADLFLTNDRKLKGLSELVVQLLDDVL